MKIGDLVTWIHYSPRYAYMIGVVEDAYKDRNDRDRCTVMWACDRAREVHLPIDILKVVK
tara:strand:- start:39 stop:218 length:180 start_codon:yes stop_codon:yes gene_type:complete